MLKFRMVLGVITVVMILALTQSGYAQLSISATGNPSTRETATNHTAETNTPTVDIGLTITGTVLSDAPITGGRLRITYPSAVTNGCIGSTPATSTSPVCATSPVTFPPGDEIRISLATGVFTGASVIAVNPVQGRVDITLPCGVLNGAGGIAALPGGGATTGTIILTGVRIDGAVITATPAQATLSNVAGGGGPNCGTSTSLAASNVILNTAAVDVITALSPGIGSVANGGMPSSVASSDITVLNGLDAGCTGDAAHADCGVATVYTNRNIPDKSATFTVTEGHSRAWFNASDTQFAGARGFVNDAGFKLTFNGLPAGVTLTLGVAAYTSGNPQLSRTAITTANNTTNVTFDANLSTSDTDRVTFRITDVSVSSSATLANGTVTLTAAMNPIGDALDTSGNGTAIPTATFPRFSDVQVGTATVLSIVPANTTLLIPFAVVAGAYDTGIALANTSADPFGSSTGGAVAQAGTVRVDLFPSTATGAGTSTNFTTSATKKAGSGIAADGTVAAGATWTVNLSELLPLAGATGPFTGYIFVQANFLYAHGAAYVYDGRGFTSSTPVLVMPPPAIAGRGGIGTGGTEVLAF